jgi:hypothetical protein
MPVIAATALVGFFLKTNETIAESRKRPKKNYEL